MEFQEVLLGGWGGGEDKKWNHRCHNSISKTWQAKIKATTAGSANKKPLFRVQPVVFEQWPIVLYEN